MPALGTLKDNEIRSALLEKRLKRLRKHPDTLVINELGLAHAKSRIDVAVINGVIHGYEIKSTRDTLDRLAAQIGIYRQTLQKLTIVAATKHIQGVLVSAPEWCGVISAEQGPRGGVQFSTIRTAYSNPDVNPVMMAHLLWRTEVVEILAQIGFTPSELRRPRKQLYELLCGALNLREITAFIRTFMAKRQTWRDHPVHV